MKLISFIILKAGNMSKYSAMGPVNCHTVDIKYFLVKKAALVSG